MADQWKEFFYCDAIDKDVLVVKGEKRVGGRSSNKKGSDNIISNGSIILMHNGAKYTKDALETVISTLQSKGYEFVTLSELVYKDHFHMDPSGKQIPD